MIVFRYQILHIGLGKKQIADTLQAFQPDLKRYEDITSQLKVIIRERRTLLAEKKTVPPIQVFRHQELVQKIVAPTEDIEELKSEKALLLSQFDCVDDQGMAKVKRRVASMESSLEKLNQQEKKYVDELDVALTQFAELYQQTESVDVEELKTVRRVIRLSKERGVIQRLQGNYGKWFDSKMLMQSQKDVAGFLDETSKPVSICQRLQQLHMQQDRLHHN